MIKLDETDRRILAELTRDAKAPAKELAEVLKIHPNTVLQRIRRLENTHVIKRYTAIIDHERIGKVFFAAIFINVKSEEGWENDLRNLFKNTCEIVAFMFLTGDFDAIVFVKVKDKRELEEVLKRVRGMEKVTKTTTQLVLEEGLGCETLTL